MKKIITIFVLSSLLAIALSQGGDHSAQNSDSFGIEAPVMDLTDENFDNFVQTGKGSYPWFIMFYAPWCPHCNRLKPIWEQVASNLSGKINVALVDCEQSPKLKYRLSVSGFPTLIYFHEKLMYEYNGPRNFGNMTEFALGGYRSAEPEDIPTEGSLIKPLIKTFQKTYRQMTNMAETNPIQATLIIGGIVGFMLLSCCCSGYLIYRMSELGKPPQSIRKDKSVQDLKASDASEAARRANSRKKDQ